MNIEELEHRFKYHAPPNEIIKGRHEEVRRACFKLSSLMEKWIPEGRELAMVHTLIEGAMMWANAGIARNPEFVCRLEDQRPEAEKKDEKTLNDGAEYWEAVFSYLDVIKDLETKFREIFLQGSWELGTLKLPWAKELAKHMKGKEE